MNDIHIDSLPPEQKVGGSNPPGRTTAFWGDRSLLASPANCGFRLGAGRRRTWTNRAAEWPYRIGFVDALAFLRINSRG